MSIIISLDNLQDVQATVGRVGISGIAWLDAVYFRSVEDNMLLVTVGNRHVQHFIEYYVHGIHLELEDQVIGIPFEVLSTAERAARSEGFRDATVTIGWGTTHNGDVIGSIEIESNFAKAGYQNFEVVKPESDVLDICDPHFYAEDSTRFRVEDARTLSRRLKTAARLFGRDEMKRCKVGWSSASVINVELLKEYEWQVVLNARITGPDYVSVIDQFSPVTFDPALLAEVLGIGERVVISLKKDLKGCVFTAGYHTALLMPIRPDSY